METFFDHYLGKYGAKLLFRSNLKQQDSTLLNLKDPFLKEIVHGTRQNLITKTITSILLPHIYGTTLTLELKIAHSSTGLGGARG